MQICRNSRRCCPAIQYVACPEVLREDEGRGCQRSHSPSVCAALDAVEWALFNYLLVEAFLVAGFFALAVFAPPGNDLPYAKNILGGLAFAFGTAMVAHVYLYDKRIVDLPLWSREFKAFAVLCILMRLPAAFSVLCACKSA